MTMDRLDTISLRYGPMLCALALGQSLAACGDDPQSDTTSLDVGYDESSARLQVMTGRELAADEALYMQVRKGEVGDIDCARDLGRLTRIDGNRVQSADEPTFEGVEAHPQDFELTYSTEWVTGEPTPQMLAQLEEGQRFIDVCIVDDGEVVEQRSFHIRRALDQAGSNGKFDGEEEEFIASTEAYAEACVADLGEIPFFERLDNGDYGTFNCLDATVIPTTVTDADGTVTLPDAEVPACDNPQYIYDLCEPSAKPGRVNGPRVTSATNEQGTDWVLLCRKAKGEEGQYNDIAMIGHNPNTGKTCYFQNALYSRTDGVNVPHPADREPSDASPQTSPSLWSGIHGGLGSGIECAECHDADPFIHTPWIDQAKRDDGSAVVPKMGERDAYVMGANDAPYSILNLEGQNWTMPEQLVSDEAAACTNCHRIGSGKWTQEWITRLDGTDQAWLEITTQSHRDFEDVFWMPPELEGLNEDNYPGSAIETAIEFIKACGDDPSACEWDAVPSGETDIEDGLPVVDLEGTALAREALKTIGADVLDPSCENDECASRRCAECHPVSRSNIRVWGELTNLAFNECRLDVDPETMSAGEAMSAIDCMRVDPFDPDSVFAAERLGILTTGVQYSYFRKLFQKAYGESWETPYAGFKRRVSMPKGNHEPLSLYEYAVMYKWFSNELVGLDTVLEEEPPPQSCDENFDLQRLASHLEEMRFEGWASVNADNGIRMYGCPPNASDARECFQSGGFADRTLQWGGEVGVVRELTVLGFNTSFWTRSSADGRFVGNGGGEHGATITDLLTGRDIGVDALYDPGFFPDNSGFIFQGTPGGTGLCAQSVLDSDDELIDFGERQCSTARGINLYQHVARGLRGGDYFVINSQFTSDPGGGSSDPRASFGANATIKLTPMIFDGTTYEALEPTIVDSPYEGDSVLSPSSEMIASRLAGPGSESLGYVIRELDAVPSNDGYVVNTSRKLATVCMPGAKPNFSFDERFMVTHHYENDRANLYLVDLTDGARYRLTDMPAGQQALFPHFVNNGWVYFLVRDDQSGTRTIAATDAAVRIALGDLDGGE